jgi:hypothetical protein
VDGLTVYVFNFTAAGLDDTAGYTSLPYVPERYWTISRGEGRLWIEPTSGVVVDFEDQGVTDFVDNATGEHVADFYHWTARYTEETRAEQWALARAARFSIRLWEVWLPAWMLLLAAVWFALDARRSAAQARTAS